MPHDLGTHHLDQLTPQTASENDPTALGIVGPRVELPIRFIRVARNEIRSVHRLRRELHYQTTSRDRSNTWTMPNSTGCSRPLLSYGPTELSSMRDRWFESVSLQQRVMRTRDLKADPSSSEPLKRSAQRCVPVRASTSCSVIRTRPPALRTEPSSN